MTMNERRAEIMRILTARRSITMPELARTFQVTTRTIQNDVVALTVDYPLETQQGKVAHNLAFESMFLYALGIIIQPPCYDTIAAAQMTLKNSFEFRCLSDSGLKKLVPELLGDELPTFEDVTGGRFFDELNSHDPETVRYACADSDYALRL